MPSSLPRLEWRPELRACPLCDGEDHRVLGTRGGASHRNGAGISAVIVRCRDCHAVYPRPALLPLGKPYEAVSTEEYFERHDRDAKTANGRFLAGQAASLGGRVGRLLEIGCGRGELLVGAREEGWSVRGVEMTEAYATAARSEGIDVELAPVESCQSLDETWDAIFLAAVLEHLYDPKACLAWVFEALAPGGVAFIDVPNECSLWTRAGNVYMRLRGRGWVVNLSPTFPPYHVVGFCPRSLRRLAVAIGFEVVELRTHRWCNELQTGRGLVGSIERAGASAALTLGAWMGAGAGITAWIRKPPDGLARATSGDRVRRGDIGRTPRGSGRKLP